LLVGVRFLPVKVLTISGFDSHSHPVVAVAIEALREGGHHVQLVTPAECGFSEAMSSTERELYHDEAANVVSSAVAESIAHVGSSQALLFCYPTVVDMMPAPIKNWLERVMLPGVAFGFNARGKVRPGLSHISRLGVVTTVTPQSGAGGAGRRTLMRALRLNCGLWCRRTFVALDGERPQVELVSSRLGSW